MAIRDPGVSTGSGKKQAIPNATIAVMKCDSNVACRGDSVFCIRMKTKYRPKVTTEAAAAKLPTSPPVATSSIKKINMPATTNGKANRCSIRGFSCNSQAPKIAVNTGAEYCNRMALAAVVVLLAKTNNSIVTALATAAATWANDQVKRG